MLNVSLQRKYFDAIKIGKKTVEGRLNSQKFYGLKRGMKMSFTTVDTNEVLWCTIEAIIVYKDFADMLCGEGVDNMLPGVTNLDEGVAIYESFPGYAQEVKKVGALAIRVKVIF